MGSHIDNPRHRCLQSDQVAEVSKEPERGLFSFARTTVPVAPHGASTDTEPPTGWSRAHTSAGLPGCYAHEANTRRPTPSDTECT